MHTDGWVTQNKPNSDGQFLVSATDFVGSGATPLFGTVTVNGLVMASLGGSAAGTFNAYSNLSGLLLRTGILQSTNYANNRSQNAFGTANGPGPSSVAGTSSPAGFGANSIIPPILNANLPTLKGSIAGAIAKGVQINWVDFLYQATGTASSGINGKMDQVVTPIGLGTTPVVTNLIPSTALSAVSQAAGKLNRVRLTPAALAMFTADGTVIELNFNYVWAAGVAVQLVGAILGLSYNFN